MQTEISFKDEKDPAFEKFIKVFLEILEVLKLPAKMGHLAEDGPNFAMLRAENFPDFRAYYEANDPNDFLTVLQEILEGLKGGEQPLNDFGKLWLDYVELWTGISNGWSDIESKICMKFVESLNEESRHYYEKFSISQEELLALDSQTKLEITKYQMSNVLSLCLHKLLLVAEKNRDVIKELRPAFLQFVFFNIWKLISLFVNDKPLLELYDAARGGLDKALFKVIKIDKTLFDHDWVRVRIRKAMYSGEEKFFKSLGQAVKYNPVKGRKSRVKEFLILTFFWEVGLYRLSIKEMLNLFQRCGLAERDDEVTFRKLVDRFKKRRAKLLLPFSHLY